MFQKLSKNPGNILVSPSSLQTILALIQMGAKGRTMNEIAKTLDLPTDKLSVQNAFKEASALLRTIKYSTFNSANKIYVQKGIEISKNFSEIAKDAFNADIEVQDFKSKKSVAVINQWVENQTNGKIKDLVEESKVNELTR